MKSIDAALLAEYQSSVKTIKEGVKITRTDGAVFRWVNHDRNVQLDDSTDSPSDLQTYLAAPGVQLTSIVSTEGFAPDTASMTVLEDADITRADILAGLWNQAEFEIFQFKWKNPGARNILKRGRIGNFQPMRGYSVVEFRDLRQAIQGQHATVLQPTCRYTLGDAKCGVNLDGGSPAPWAVSGTVDSSASQYSITDSARTEAADWFGEGSVTFIDGLNAGFRQKVKTFSSGVFVFWNQFIYPIGTDAYVALPGCRLRFREDCITKFGNGVNFGGEPNRLNPDTLTAPA